MTTVAEYEALSDQAGEHWLAAHRARNAALDVTVKIIARVSRDHFPDAATLVLDPHTERDGWEAGEVLDAQGAILSDVEAEGQDVWDLAGPDHSTNAVSSLVGDLESGMDWETFAPPPAVPLDPHDDRRFLDLSAVLGREAYSLGCIDDADEEYRRQGREINRIMRAHGLS